MERETEIRRGCGAVLPKSDQRHRRKERETRSQAPYTVDLGIHVRSLT